MIANDPERRRLEEADQGTHDWRRWGPYLAERQWGTVREDYSPDGDAWNAFPHDHARSRAYRWGEDGLLGVCDSEGVLCFSLALWNGADPFLKERLFGLSNPQGNHGEDVKECYYYLDATPTASWLRGLYKYPQARFPYERLVEENARRGRTAPEYELADTGAFDAGRYFDVFVEYAKASPEDLLVRITAANRGPDAAPLHVLPTLWFRNTWSWGGGYYHRFGRPSIRASGAGEVVAEHALLGRYVLAAGASRDSGEPCWIFTENETNAERLWGVPNRTPWTKDAFHSLVVEGRREAVNPARVGTKAAALYRLVVPAGERVELRLRLSRDGAGLDLGTGFEEVFRRRIADADRFYEGLARPEDAAILRQAAAGLVWTKQFYYYDVREWLEGDPVRAPPPERARGRNAEWGHLVARDVISMPDKWEFPWLAAWDLAFHTLPFALLDQGFARQQLQLMLREWYMAPNGQLAAYEYGFGDVNPPVHAWACRRLHRFDGPPDAAIASFLRRVFVKLAMNFTWWVNRKDPEGRNLFAGGFMGLDNIGVFDRSRLPPGLSLEQADSTAWMAHFCSEMTAIALVLANIDPEYEIAATTFVRHFAQISEAINGAGGLWDEEDGFYYDHLRTGGGVVPLRVRSIVGLLPMVAVAVADQARLEQLPRMTAHMQEFFERYPRLVNMSTLSHEKGGATQRRLLALVPRDRLERLLRRLLDEDEFLSPYGIRSLSRHHLAHPYMFEAGGERFEVSYRPGESDSGLFGGNSNWRGPIWFPMNALLIEALDTYHRFYGDSLKVELPTGSGNRLDLGEVADALTERLLNLFRPDASGRRPCHGDDPRYAEDPHWRELILFNEYFHGDSGRGCGASHQTGWTGLAALFANRRTLR